MNVDDRIDAILDNLIKSGSDINYIKELKDKSASEISKDYDLKEVLNNIALDIENITKEFLDKKMNLILHLSRVFLQVFIYLITVGMELINIL